MKYIVAIIRPEKLQEVIAALDKVELGRLTVGDCRGVGKMEKTAEVYRGVQYTVNYRLKSKIEIAVKDEHARTAVDTINEASKTGDPTDGVIFVMDLLECVNIGTGKTDAEAV